MASEKLQDANKNFAQAINNRIANTTKTNKTRDQFVIAIAMFALVSASLSFVLSLLTERGVTDRNLTEWLIGKQPAALQDRIATLSKSLTEATDIIAQIEKEVTQRMELVNELERQRVISEKLVNASKDQVNAIAALLRDELERDDTWDFWISFLQNMLFLVAGVFLSHFIEKWMNKKKAIATVPNQ